MNTQKRNILLVLVMLANFLVMQAQTTPLRPLADLDEDFILDNDLYVKDTNNELGQFLGIWEGTFDGKTYEFKIERHIDNANFFEFKIDILIMRYIIRENNETIINTLSLPIDHDHIIYGIDYRTPNGYRFIYAGEESRCGQSGIVAVRKINSDSMKLVLLPDHILLRNDLCPNGYTTHILPTSSIVLTKQ